MRLKITLALAAVAAAGGAVVAAAPTATTQQIVCPPGTIAKRVTNPVTGGQMTVCVPGQQCDPGPCPSTAPPARD